MPERSPLVYAEDGEDDAGAEDGAGAGYDPVK